MKHFVNALERAASGHENYIEFQIPSAKEEFWDSDSLYMSEAAMEESGFGEFWSDCVFDGLVFDSDSINKDDLHQMMEAAKRCGGTVLEVMCELKSWAETKLTKTGQRIGVINDFHRALDRRRAETAAYPIDPKFTQEERALHGLPSEEYQEQYEALLRKYNMPACFFPFPTDCPDR